MPNAGRAPQHAASNTFADLESQLLTLGDERVVRMVEPHSTSCWNAGEPSTGEAESESAASVTAAIRTSPYTTRGTTPWATGAPARLPPATG
jgi:hypothetical protein